MSLRFAALTLAGAAVVSGCSLSPGQVTAAANTTISKAQQDAQNAINLYGIAKGIGEVASIADPTIAPALGAVTAAVDPQIAQAQAALNSATVDANALEALATAITQQANVLTAKAAPVITVIPTVPVPPPAG